MKLHILAIGAHPDDVELGTAGVLIKHQQKGQLTGVLDLTEGELGTRGTATTRYEEAAAAAAVLKLSMRHNLRLRDGFFINDEESRLKIVEIIRHYRPDIILANAYHDRHPDHGRASELIADACFLSGLKKVQTSFEGTEQQPWRPLQVFHYIQDRMITPDIVVDISDTFEQKMEAVKCYTTQFATTGEDKTVTYISQPGFLENIKARAIHFGHSIGARYGEGFCCRARIGVRDLDALHYPAMP